MIDPYFLRPERARRGRYLSQLPLNQQRCFKTFNRNPRPLRRGLGDSDIQTPTILIAERAATTIAAGVVCGPAQRTTTTKTSFGIDCGAPCKRRMFSS
jgi:hypothetical protein